MKPPARASAWAVAARMYVKVLRETARRPVYGTTFLGIPMALMLVFGTALAPAEMDQEPPRLDGDHEGELRQAAGLLGTPDIATEEGRGSTSPAPSEDDPVTTGAMQGAGEVVAPGAEASESATPEPLATSEALRLG